MANNTHKISVIRAELAQSTGTLHDRFGPTTREFDPMENHLRAELVTWLRDDPELLAINAIEEEAPVRASAPWLGIAASASTDWGTKDRPGREVRIAIELESRADEPEADGPLLNAIERRVLNLPPFHSNFELASVHFLRARSEEREGNLR
ncbi:MAG: DUF3168 domain-containing protein, partial [Pseudomonadota bacterium]